MDNQPKPFEMPERPADTKAAGNIVELLDRILDKGIVIIGDIRISVADIELLKVQIRLLIASVDKAKEMGIDFSWAKSIEEPVKNEQLQHKIKELQDKIKEHGQDNPVKDESPSSSSSFSTPGE